MVLVQWINLFWGSFVTDRSSWVLYWLLAGTGCSTQWLSLPDLGRQPPETASQPALPCHSGIDGGAAGAGQTFGMRLGRQTGRMRVRQTAAFRGLVTAILI